MSLLGILQAEVSHAQVKLHKIHFMTDLLMGQGSNEGKGQEFSGPCVVFPKPATEDCTHCADWYVVSGEQLSVDEG